jgi:transposase
MPITVQQLKAAKALASGLSQGEAAKRAGVARITVCRWLKNSVFKQKVEELSERVEAVETEVFVERIRENAHKSLSPDELKAILSEIATNEEIRPDTRIKAVATLGKWAGLEDVKPTASTANDFPIPEDATYGGMLKEGEKLDELSYEQLSELYLKTLAQG